MGYLYIILSILCRLFPLESFFRAAHCLRYLPASTANRKNDCDIFSLWLPIVGWCTVWTTRKSESDSQFEIVRIERDVRDVRIEREFSDTQQRVSQQLETRKSSRN